MPPRRSRSHIVRCLAAHLLSIDAFLSGASCTPDADRLRTVAAPIDASTEAPAFEMSRAFDAAAESLAPAPDSPAADQLGASQTDTSTTLDQGSVPDAASPADAAAPVGDAAMEVAPPVTCTPFPAAQVTSGSATGATITGPEFGDGKTLNEKLGKQFMVSIRTGPPGFEAVGPGYMALELEDSDLYLLLVKLRYTGMQMQCGIDVDLRPYDANAKYLGRLFATFVGSAGQLDGDAKWSTGCLAPGQEGYALAEVGSTVQQPASLAEVNLIITTQGAGTPVPGVKLGPDCFAPSPPDRVLYRYSNAGAVTAAVRTLYSFGFDQMDRPTFGELTTLPRNSTGYPLFTLAPGAPIHIRNDAFGRAQKLLVIGDAASPL